MEFGSVRCEASRRWAETALSELQVEFGTDLAHWYVDITPPGDAAVAAGIAACLADVTPPGMARAWLTNNAPGKLPEEIADAAASRFGVDASELHACARSQGWDLARARVQLAADLGVPGTPTLIVGRRDRRGDVVGWVFLGYSSPDTLRPYVEAVRSRRPRARLREPPT